ncbi:MAG TPA: lipid-A-disaccharide synthase [Thiotrichales bacterium]|nr:lipid-A-disaccharide synthase [Thiotrichales bacterium]
MDDRPLTIAMVAGEVSGDLLGADLMEALLARAPDIRFLGIGGPRMQALGFESRAPMEALSHMGLLEVVRHLPGLIRLRRRLAAEIERLRPDVFVGIDAPDFNLGLERHLRRRGIPVVHYVSPSVWAWRQYRVRRIRESVDRMLTLFPFEADFYRVHHVPVLHVGHPLADRIPMETDPQRARQALGLPEDRVPVAVLPGSRTGEVRRLGPLFIETMTAMLAERGDLHFVVPFANAATRALFEAELAARADSLPLTLVDGDSRTVMTASEAVLLASGTAALEALLLKRPMVVAYRLSPLTYRILRRMVRIPYYSLPNLLAGRPLVPELVQDAATPGALASAMLEQLARPQAAYRAACDEIHARLRMNAGARAADAVLEVAGHA